MSRDELTGEGGASAARRDLLASVVVFLVALPLCLGVALASGVPPAVGLITGILGGLVAGALSGSPLQVSGPTASLTVLVWEWIQGHGVETLGPVVLLAGVLQILAGLCRLGGWFRAVSPAVVQGMLSGIGVLIVTSQFHVMVDDAPKGGGLANLVSIPLAVWKGVVPSDDTTHEEAALLGLLTIGALLAWKPWAPGRLKAVPAPLAAIVAATAVAELGAFPVQRVTMPENLWSAVRLPGPEWLSLLRDGSVFFAAASVALVASGETLLCAAALDQLQDGPRSRFDRELAAQGVGNLLCGLAGALPMAGVIVRSATNVAAGARTRRSAVLHGIWMLLFVCLFPALLQRIPTASLAAVVVYTGCKLANPQAVRSLLPFGKGEVAIYLVTVAVIVVDNLLTGVLVGVGLSVVKLVYTCSRLAVKVRHEPDGGAELSLRGAATFLRLPQLAAALEQIEPAAQVRLEYAGLIYIDHACLELLQIWERQHTARGGAVLIEWETLYARFQRPYRVPELPAEATSPNGKSGRRWWPLGKVVRRR